MAIWQAAFFLVNRERVFRYTDPDFLNTLNALKKTFPEEKSWCKSIRQYGHIDSTCIELGVDHDLVEDEISVRIDLRSISTPQLKVICDFAAANQLRISHNDELCEATVDNMIGILKQSNAYRFIADPEQYFQEISKNH